MKLIKLSKEHYIIVDDSEIKENDWYWTPIKRSIEQCVKKLLIIKKGQNDVEQYKITHSTQPLENGIGKLIDGTYPPQYPRFNKIKPLSLLQVEEVIYGYNLKKLKADFANEELNSEFPLLGTFCSLSSSFEEGFNTHKELVKDKLFTIEDVKQAFIEGSNFRQKWVKEIPLPNSDIILIEPDVNKFIQSLLPKEWNIEIQEGKIKLL